MRIEVTQGDIAAKLDIRPDTTDAMFVREIWDENYYLQDISIGPDSVVVDIGAHIGIFTVLAAKLGATVYAYEPIPEHLDLLEMNLLINGVGRKVFIRPVALTADGRPVEMVVPETGPDRNTGCSRIGPAEPNHYSIKIESLAVADELATIGRIDLLKMDVEGSEYEIIRALDERSLSQIAAIVMEFHGSPEKAYVLGNHLQRFGYFTRVDWSWGEQGRLTARRGFRR